LQVYTSLHSAIWDHLATVSQRVIGFWSYALPVTSFFMIAGDAFGTIIGGVFQGSFGSSS
jgi:hypothetical protein